MSVCVCVSVSVCVLVFFPLNRVYLSSLNTILSAEIAEEHFASSFFSSPAFAEGRIEEAYTEAFAATDNVILAAPDMLARHSGSTALCVCVIDNVC